MNTDLADGSPVRPVTVKPFVFTDKAGLYPSSTVDVEANYDREAIRTRYDVIFAPF